MTTVQFLRTTLLSDRSPLGIYCTSTAHSRGMCMSILYVLSHNRGCIFWEGSDSVVQAVKYCFCFLGFFFMILESVVWYGIQIWYGDLLGQLKSKLARVTKAAQKTVRVNKLNYFQCLYNKSLLREAQKIRDGPTHSLNPEFESLPSGWRFRMPKCQLNQHNTFIPSSIRLVDGNKSSSTLWLPFLKFWGALNTL